MKIYFVATANDIIRDEKGWLDWGKSHRVVGFFEKLEDAERAVENNYGDIYEDGYYKYAIIEEHETGLYSTCMKPLFYRWKGSVDNGGYERIRRPRATYGFCNFTF